MIFFDQFSGPINWFLSLRVWEVLGKLTYSMYLIHILVMSVISGVTRHPIYLSGSKLVSLIKKIYNFNYSNVFMVLFNFRSQLFR